MSDCVWVTESCCNCDICVRSSHIRRPRDVASHQLPCRDWLVGHFNAPLESSVAFHACNFDVNHIYMCCCQANLSAIDTHNNTKVIFRFVFSIENPLFSCLQLSEKFCTRISWPINIANNSFQAVMIFSIMPLSQSWCRWHMISRKWYFALLLPSRNGRCGLTHSIGVKLNVMRSLLSEQNVVWPKKNLTRKPTNM